MSWGKWSCRGSFSYISHTHDVSMVVLSFFEAESTCPLEFQDSPNLLPPPTLNVNCKSIEDHCFKTFQLHILKTFVLKLCYYSNYTVLWYFAFSLDRFVRFLLLLSLMKSMILPFVLHTARCRGEIETWCSMHLVIILTQNQEAELGRTAQCMMTLGYILKRFINCSKINNFYTHMFIHTGDTLKKTK